MIPTERLFPIPHSSLMGGRRRTAPLLLEAERAVKAAQAAIDAGHKVIAIFGALKESDDRARPPARCRGSFRAWRASR